MLILSHHSCRPEISSGVFVAPNASVIGEVDIGENSSLWFNTVVRGDVNSISIGRRTNIQDGTVIHVSHDAAVVIGDDVTVGHAAVLHGCRVGNGCLIGMRACLLDGVEVGDESLVAAGSLVVPGTLIPSGSLVVGAPAKVKRQLTAAERDELKASAAGYVETIQTYLPLMSQEDPGVTD